MLFSSIPFLFWFLPGVLLLYAAAPEALKNTVLLLSSLFFYGWGEPRYVIWMVLAILMAYIFGLLIERYQSVPKLARLFLALSVSSSLLMLGYFKYADFFIRNVNAATISVAILWALLGATPIPKSFCRRLQQRKMGTAVMLFAEPLALSALLLICTAFLVDGSFNPFLYFRF